MAKKKSIKENEKAQKEDEAINMHQAEDGEGDADKGGDGDHADAAQDVALIKKMIAKHLGDSGKDMSQEEMEAMHELGMEAYQAYKDMGHKEDEAEDMAGHALKLAHHMTQKRAKQNENEDNEIGGDIKKKMPPEKKAKAEDVPDDSEENECGKKSEAEDEGKKMESNRVKELEKKLLQAEGRVAALEAKTRKAEVQEYVDGKLKESGQPNYVTKRFRDVAGEIKSKEDFESKWKVFQEGAKGSRASLDWSLLAEKSTSTEDGTKKSGASLDFSKCAE